MKRSALTRAFLAAVAVAPGALAGQIPHAKVVFEAFQPALATHVPEAAPPRFVLLEDDRVFVGGTSVVLSGEPDKRVLKELDKRLDRVRKLRNLGGQVSLGSGEGRYRLLIAKGRPIDMTISGDPSQATSALRPLAELIAALSEFHDEGLRPYAPASLLVQARQAPSVGGCRPWTLDQPPSAFAFAPQVLPAEGLESWPRGASPAFVCGEGRSYVVTFRPLLPGEQP